MEITDKYISEAEAQVKPDKDKITLPTETYALIEALNNLATKLELLRLK